MAHRLTALVAFYREPRFGSQQGHGGSQLPEISSTVSITLLHNHQALVWCTYTCLGTALMHTK